MRVLFSHSANLLALNVFSTTGVGSVSIINTCGMNANICSSPFSTRQRDWSTASVVTTTLHHCCSSCTDSVPERVTSKFCVMVYRCLHGIGPEYFSENVRFVSEIYLFYLLFVRPPVPTLWFLSHAGLHLVTELFRSQELERGTCYRPVSPPHHLCPHSGDSWRHFFSSDNGVNNTNKCKKKL